MDRASLAILTKVREELLIRAEAAMQFPREEPFHHGVQVGFWQGLKEAHSIIEAVLQDEEEKERR